MTCMFLCHNLMQARRDRLPYTLVTSSTQALATNVTSQGAGKVLLITMYNMYVCYSVSSRHSIAHRVDLKNTYTVLH